jgi:hypothetical protein
VEDDREEEGGFTLFYLVLEFGLAFKFRTSNFLIASSSFSPLRLRKVASLLHLCQIGGPSNWTLLQQLYKLMLKETLWTRSLASIGRWVGPSRNKLLGAQSWGTAEQKNLEDMQSGNF